MPQQTSPFLEGKYGWAFGEDGWNTGVDENFLKFSFMFDRNVDSIVSSLPSAVNGQSHYLTTDNRLYFAIGSVYYSSPVPKWFIIFVKSTGQTHQFNGTSLVQIDTAAQLDTRLDAVELTVSTLGTAAFENIEFFATQTDLDVAEATAAAYTDTLRTDLSSSSDSNKGDALVGVKRTTMAVSVSDTVHKWIERRHVYVEEFGALGDGFTDDATKIQAAIDAIGTLGGGVVYLSPGKIYFATTLPVLKDGVVLDGNFSRINATLGSGNVFGTRVVTNSGLRRIKIYVTSTGSPSSQFIFHTCISLGAPNNNGDSVASPDPFYEAYNWFIEDVELHTTRQHCPVIQGFGHLYNGHINGVRVPDSSTCSGINFDWGTVGLVESSDIAGTRTRFDSNLAYTTHPHNIRIEDVKLGTLSVVQSGDLGSNLVRLSACYNIEVSNTQADSVTLAMFLHTGGDLGFEFAPANVKHQACKGNVFRKSVLLNPTTTINGVFIDTLADNVYREQFAATPYTPLIDPLMHGRVTIEDCNLTGPFLDSKYGARIIQARGVEIKNCTVSRWDDGIWIDEFCKDINVENNDTFSNRRNGIKVGTALSRENTSEVRIVGNRSYRNGTEGTFNGIFIARGHDIWVVNNILGERDETIQDRGIFVQDDGAACRDVHVVDNHCLGTVVSAYTLTLSTPSAPYEERQIGSFRNNTADTSCVTLLGGQAIIPIQSRMYQNSPAREWLTGNSSAPTTGTWYVGDLIWRANPVAASFPAIEVITAGTFGALSGVTNAATTSGSAVVTMSLASKTATTTAGAYTFTINDASNVRAGQRVTISAAGITNALTLSVSGTTISLDVFAKITQAGGTATIAGVIEGEVVSLDTTPTISSAIVMKVSGNNVTLNVAASSTESSRTVSFTTPIFKNHSNLSA